MYFPIKYYPGWALTGFELMKPEALFTIKSNHAFKPKLEVDWPTFLFNFVLNWKIVQFNYRTV